MFCLGKGDVLGGTVCGSLSRLVTRCSVVRPTRRGRVCSTVLTGGCPRGAVICRNPCCYSFGGECGLLYHTASLFALPVCGGCGAPFVTGDHLTGRFLVSGNVGRGHVSIYNIKVSASTFLGSSFSRVPPRVSGVSDVRYNVGLLCVNGVRPEHGYLFLVSILGGLHRGNISTGLVVINDNGRSCLTGFSTRVGRLGLNSCVCGVGTTRRGCLSCVCRGASIFLLPAVCRVFNVILLRTVCFNGPIVAARGNNSSVLVRGNGAKVVRPRFGTRG